ncbi:hypothetical protein GF327_02355 [Candidatus Woesearchaeota archaeon]|nr:hypothetical protein [Candidatus Woesearchaeota archaeon]
MDCVGTHYNQGATSPYDTAGHPDGIHYSYYFTEMIDTYTSVFTNKPLCFTEIGYVTKEGFSASLPEGFLWAEDISETDQADWLKQAVEISLSSDNIEMIIIWNIDFTEFRQDPMAGYAIIRPGGTCPACEKFKDLCLDTREAEENPAENQQEEFSVINPEQPPIPTVSPDLTNTRTTSYRTAYEGDFNHWYNGEPLDKSGLWYCQNYAYYDSFYSDVKCEGSGVTISGKVCRYHNIGITQDENCVESLENFRGSTRSGTNPTAKRTIAVDPSVVSLGTLVYIYWGEEYDDWNGCFRAEDTGGAIEGNHFDIYSGVGDESTGEINIASHAEKVWIGEKTGCTQDHLRDFGG